MTAVTPTMIPIRVSPVRSLFWRRLARATKKASQVAASLKAGNERIRAGRERRWPESYPRGGSASDALWGNIAEAILLCLLVFFDQPVADRNDATRARGNIAFVRHQDYGVAVFVKLLEEVHDVVAGGRIQRAGWFVGEQD